MSHCTWGVVVYDSVSKSFQPSNLEQELQMIQFSATRCSCIVILRVSLVSFASITLCVASQRVFVVVSVKCDPRFSVISEMADLKEQRMKCSKQLSVTMPQGEHKLLSGSLDSNVGRTSRTC
jgi:hypothetical protein